MSLLILQVLTTILPPLEFDLAKLLPTVAACQNVSSSAETEIVVCAKRRGKEVQMSVPPAEEALPKAEFKLFGKVRGKIAGEQGNVGGFVSNRAVVTMTVPF
jgi:hypothetical protein